MLTKKKLEDLTQEEISLIVEQIKRNPKPKQSTFKHDFGSKHVKIGYLSDTHIGAKEFRYDIMDKARKHMKQEGVEAVYHPGDIIEGMSNREGSFYELGIVGVTPQIREAAELINQWDIPFHAITGNHDYWSMQKGNQGVNVGEELSNRCKGFNYLGGMEADVELYPGVILKLFHANDGTAYANSYKLQKLVESFEGGKKPNIVFSGHYHKSLYQFTRNVHGFECATLCGQTGWMRGKKIQAHVGYGIVELWFGKNGVQRLKHEFVPGY